MKTTDPRLTGQTASNLQSILISEYDHGDYQWITRHTIANWGTWRKVVTFRIATFGGPIAGLHPHHVY